MQGASNEPTDVPVQFSVDYPYRPLDRLSTLIVLGAVSGATMQWNDDNRNTIIGVGGLPLPAEVPPLMDDRYPSTDEQQSVHLDYAYPDAKGDLNRWMPLVSWFLAIPHFFVLIILNIAAVFVVIGAWVAILITDEYPPFRLYP